MEITTRNSAPKIKPRKYGLSCLSAWCVSLVILNFGVVPARAQTDIVLVGSGGSVTAPLFNRWAEEYGKRNSRVKMRYLSVGTDEGIKGISHGTADFAAGEARLTDQERKEEGLIQLPAVIIGIAPIYKLPEVHEQLRLSGEVLAEIFLGDLKMWDSPAIAKLNPNVTLPNVRIQVINRPAGKGSNYAFTDFLSKTSSKFRAQIGVTASPTWPVGTPAERSSDMIDKVKSEEGAIGFVELQYAVKANIPTVAVLNSAGKYVKGDSETVTAACLSVEAPGWKSFAASLTNASGPESFPITSFSWIYLRTAPPDANRATALRDLLDWIYSDGQRFTTEEGYTELPEPLLAAIRARVKELH